MSRTPRSAAASGPGAITSPDEVAEVLWRHHSERGEFQTRLGID
jgi:hypothetical protein